MRTLPFVTALLLIAPVPVRAQNATTEPVPVASARLADPGVPLAVPSAPPPTASQIATRSVLAVGGPAIVVTEGIHARLLQVIRPDAPESIGNGTHTEYVFALTNRLADRELRLTQPALTVAGAIRRPPASAMEILRPAEATERVQAQARGLSLFNLLGAFLPAAGALIVAQAGAVGTVVAKSAWQQELIANPRAWAAELQKRAFQNVQGAEVIVFPGETATGSLWIRQSPAERASRIQFFVRTGGEAGRLLGVDIEDNAPVAATAVPTPPVSKE